MQVAMTRRPGGFSLLCAVMVACLSGNLATAAAAPKAAVSGARSAAATDPIDWSTVEHGSPIPHQMPVADADTASASGFSPQWIQRSITQWPPSVQDPDLPAKLVSRIAKGVRRSDDPWAREVANRLRATLQANGTPEVLRYARVFCGSEGCLCYFDMPDSSPSLEPYDRARNSLIRALVDKEGWGQAFGIKPTDVDEVGETGVWELIYIVRGKAKG